MKLHQEFLPANRQSDMKQPTLCEQKYSSDEALIKSWEEYFLLRFVIFIGFCTSVSNDDLKMLWLLLWTVYMWTQHNTKLEKNLWNTFNFNALKKYTHTYTYSICTVYIEQWVSIGIGMELDQN